MQQITEDLDFGALFGIEIDGAVPADTAALLCTKCHGRGTFSSSYSGRPVGKCFTCDGTGLGRSAGLRLAPGACTKCAGTGEWRPGRPCFACAGKGREGETAEISVEAIATAFAAARAKGIKAPRLRLDAFVFSRAPDTGRNAGSIYVKEKAGEYLGKITDGRFHPTAACDDPTRTRVVAVAADPHMAAKAYGQRTGECSCCGRELTNGESIALGIGPICRGKFGW